MKFIPAKLLKFGLNCWPPFWGTGIKVRKISKDFRYARVEMKMAWYNKNYVGVHFGGSLYALTDPFYMLMTMHSLGKNYYVWDKGATIEYIKPAKGRITAEFRVTDEMLANFKAQTAGGNKYCPELSVELLNEDKQTVARLVRTLYIRKKPRERNNES